ncbi:hypothetical protein [Nocardia spumae]|uniref:hypothetical protein n=1 Tax=Nocardia spumae TaxID=2887190 RepID=UPI001D14BF75|nr:hypothetical protein [Nocardia spumae]
MPDNEFGYTPWGMGWVRLAEPMTATRPEPLLPRARSIARNGGVRLEIEGSSVCARIHRGSQASVTHLEVVSLSSSQVSAIAERIPAHTVELTDTVHAALSAADALPRPRLADSDCSCSARTPRCLHLLATCYALARQVDENPWLTLDLQGYRRGGRSEDSDTPPARWTSIDALDPGAFFTYPA